ncbi:MAG: hypothetical protein ACQEXB_01015 [Bacillota bacterium]
MLKPNDIIMYQDSKHIVLYVCEAGYCKIKKLKNPKYIELVHRKDLKQRKVVK